jgi:hypothetical protein
MGLIEILGYWFGITSMILWFFHIPIVTPL